VGLPERHSGGSIKHAAPSPDNSSRQIPNYISGATPGYKVTVSVSVVKGNRTARCSTSFTPHR
jgi:hypothetical protein